MAQVEGSGTADTGAGPQNPAEPGKNAVDWRGSHVGFLLDASLVNAFRTSECEILNCRAICDGLSPALKAARTAFNLPGVKATETSSTLRFCEFSFEGSFLPRRCCSTSTAAPNWSRSWSLRLFIALRRSFGRMCRSEGAAVASASVAASEDGVEYTDGDNAAENRSGAVDRSLVPPMP